MEKGFVLKTVINGVDMFYGTCDVEGDIIEEGLIGSFMTPDKSEADGLSKMTEAYQPSKDITHKSIIWSVEEVEANIL